MPRRSSTLDTGGGSIRKGLANWADDMLHNHGMPCHHPPAVQERREHRDVAGAVIHRSKVFELIQYTPQTNTVYHVPWS